MRPLSHLELARYSSDPFLYFFSFPEDLNFHDGSEFGNAKLQLADAITAESEIGHETEIKIRRQEDKIGNTLQLSFVYIWKGRATKLNDSLESAYSHTGLINKRWARIERPHGSVSLWCGSQISDENFCGVRRLPKTNNRF